MKSRLQIQWPQVNAPGVNQSLQGWWCDKLPDAQLGSERLNWRIFEVLKFMIRFGLLWLWFTYSLEQLHLDSRETPVWFGYDSIIFNMIYDYLWLRFYLPISCKPMLLPMFLPMFYYVPVIFLTSRHTKVTGHRSFAKRLGINGQCQALQRHQASLEDVMGSSDQDFSW